MKNDGGKQGKALSQINKIATQRMLGACQGVCLIRPMLYRNCGDSVVIIIKLHYSTVYTC